jgi:peptidoglycan/xylan/chitin deacetylase (PgdA/CDA1 family)
MDIYSKLNLPSFSLEKLYRLALKLSSVTNFFYYHPQFGKRNLIEDDIFNCVIFRLDDVPYDLPIYDKSLIDIHLAIMDVFSKKNQNLTLGVVVRYLEVHPNLLEYILQGHRRGIFELALHGWDHHDYSKLSKMNQERSLLRANTKMLEIFGVSSKIFIPPYNEFNRSTIGVLKQLGIKIISSSVYSDYHRYFVGKQTRKDSKNYKIYHLPEMASFESFEGMKLIRIPLERIIRTVEHHISKYGYAVITLHPQSFAKFTERKSTQLSLKQSKLDINQINELDALIQNILDRNIRIKSFSKVTGIE